MEGKRLERFLKIRNIVLNSVCAAIALAGIYALSRHFVRYSRYEITNDAVVDQYIVPLNIRAGGYVRQVRFKEHSSVKAGDTLLVLDDREYRIKVSEAEAALAEAVGELDVLEYSVTASKQNISVQQAGIAEASSRVWQLEQDYRRYDNLVRDGTVPMQQYEQAKSAYEAAVAQLDALKSRCEAAKLQYEETRSRRTGVEANIRRREADLEMARLDLSYTVLVAPFDGVTGRRTLDEGQYVQNGQTITNLVRSSDKWVTANYKETQIASIRIGQKVRIRVDAYKDKIFMGTVTAISEATGSKYSLVPTDNSAGNFVKIQQRIPVRIDLDDASPEEMQLLRAGMMVVAEAVKE